MRVLIACEESQRVALEFRKMGHEAYSCDLEEAGGGHDLMHLLPGLREEGGKAMIVIEKRDVPENCTTCLYGRPNGCAHADRQRDWMRYRVWMGLERCPSWWLDQNRFERA